MSISHDYPQHDVSLMEYVKVVLKWKKAIACFVLAVVLLAAVYSLLAKKTYMANAVIMSIGKGGSGGGGLSSLMGQMGGLAGLAGLSGGVGQTQNQQFMALLKTRTLAEDVIKKHDLMPVLLPGYDPSKAGPNDFEAATRTLQGAMTFNEDKKNGTMVITAEFGDPRIVADLANYYADGLKDFINKNSFTVAKKNRLFIEEQLAQNKRDLLEAGKELNAFYKGEKVSSVESQINVDISPAVHSEDNDNIDDSSVRKQLDVLSQQKKEIQDKLVVKNVPQQVYLQYLTLKRSVSTQINSLLTQQYEMAKIDEAKDELTFQIIDSARVPLVRSKPQRFKMVLMSFVVSTLVGVFASFGVEHLQKMKLEHVG